MAAAAAQGGLEATAEAEEMAAATAQGDLGAAAEAEEVAAAEVAVEPMMQLTRKQRQNLTRKRSFKMKNMQAKEMRRNVCWKGVQGDSKSEAV